MSEEEAKKKPELTSEETLALVLGVMSMLMPLGGPVSNYLVYKAWQKRKEADEEVPMELTLAGIFGGIGTLFLIFLIVIFGLYCAFMVAMILFYVLFFVFYFFMIFVIMIAAAIGGL